MPASSSVICFNVKHGSTGISKTRPRVEVFGTSWRHLFGEEGAAEPRQDSQVQAAHDEARDFEEG